MRNIRNILSVTAVTAVTRTAVAVSAPADTTRAPGKDRAKLRSVLLYHVAEGRLTAAKVTKRRAVKTLNGQRLAIRVRGGKAFVGGARVVTPDVSASNGVIHVINKVLLPR